MRRAKNRLLWQGFLIGRCPLWQLGQHLEETNNNKMHWYCRERFDLTYGFISPFQLYSASSPSFTFRLEKKYQVGFRIEKGEAALAG